MLVTDSGRYDDALVARLLDTATAELTAAGVGPGTAVVLCLPNDVRWVSVYRALGRIGAVSVPLNAGSAIAEIAHAIADSGARLALVPAAAVPVLADRFPDRVLWPDGRATGDRISPGPDGSTEVATIAYTSGTTGTPKGVLQSRQAVRLGGTNIAERLRWTADDVVVTALPLAHSYGTNVLNAVAASGATLVLLSRFDETRLGTAAQRWGATVLAGVPTMYRRLLAQPMSARLRCALSAGQSAGTELANAWETAMGGAFVEGWGMTELAGFATLSSPDLPDRHGTVGTAVPDVRLRTADSTVSELQVAGPMVTAGHVGAASRTTAHPAAAASSLTAASTTTPDHLTAARATTPSPDTASATAASHPGAASPLAVNGWLPTGDLGSIDADGRVRILGRAKDIVLSGGFSIYPAEVERVVARHPDVADVAVAGLPDPVRGEIVCAWIVPRSGARPSVAQIAEFCRPHLAAYKWPRRIVLLPELPLSGTGKLLRRELLRVEVSA